MIPLIGSPPPAAEAKFRAALRLVGEALIEWASAVPSPLAVEPSPAPAAAPAPTAARPMARPISEMLVWTVDHDRRVRELAGTAPAQQVADQLGVSLSTLYNHCSRLKVSLAVGRKKGHQVRPKASPAAEPAPSAPTPAPAGSEEKAGPAKAENASTERRTFVIPEGHEAERDADGRATGATLAVDRHDEGGPAGTDADPPPLAQEQAVTLADATLPAPETIAPAMEAAPEANAVQPVEPLRGDDPAIGGGPAAQHVPVPTPETPATVQKAPAKERRAPTARKAAAQPVKAAPTTPSPKAPARALIVTRGERDMRDIGVRPRGDVPTPNRRSPTIGVSRAASGASWFRLRHPDGRWLRMDCLGWVAERQDGYLGQMKLLDNVRAKFPLAAECVVVPEPAWHARDIEFSRVTR